MRWLNLAFLFLSFPVFGQQLGFALEQINGQAIIDAGLTGKGVKIGIIDGGFLRADEIEALSDLFENSQIKGYRDYLDTDALPFSGSAKLDDQHGTEVWELIAGFSNEKQVQYGLATGATFYLARTDHGGYEKRQEEQYALEAMEWMAGEGVKIINLSLGYNFGFTDKKENYKPAQMDGKSTLLTQAVDRLSREYGILFVVAAGNDGDTKWQIVDSPADARSALSVGATKFRVNDAMNFSSKGPEWLAYVKPEISCYSAQGTSFSTPVITGLAACLLEAKPELIGDSLKQLIIRSGDLALPNNRTGYGVPDARKALNLLRGEFRQPPAVKVSNKNTHKFELEKPSIYIRVYHKKGWKVIETEKLAINKTKVRVGRKQDATSSTVFWEGGSLEIIWEE